MKRAALFVAVVLLSQVSSAQQTGFPPYGSFQNGGFDSVNRQNLNVNIAIPVVANPGRGQAFTFSIVYDSLIWQRNGSYWTPVADPYGNPTWGWKKDSPKGVFTISSESVLCVWYTEEWIRMEEWTQRYHSPVYFDAAGTPHYFPAEWYTEATTCGYSPTEQPGLTEAGDGSGITWDSTNGNEITIPDGSEFTGTAWKDSNGNYFSMVTVSSTETHWKDTLGRVALKIIKRTNCTRSSVTYPTCFDYKYRTADNTERTMTLYLDTFHVKTNFGCSGEINYNQSGKQLPVYFDLPNGRSYTFEYEQTPGDGTKTTARLKKVTLPTTGYYQYDYTGSNYGINCADGKVNGLDRIVNDGSSQTWSFVRSQVSSDWKTRVTAPALYGGSANETTFLFTSSGQLITTKVYTGSEASGTLLRTLNRTWANGAPNSEVTILEDTPGSSKLQSKTETVFDSHGNLKELKEYDYGSGSPPSTYIRKTTIAYLHESQSAYLTRNIVNRATSIRVDDASGNKKSETLIEYDQSTPAQATGAPQHDDSGYGTNFNYRGNVTKVRRWLTGSTYLDMVMTYDMLGNVLTVQDPGSHTTSISYSDSWYDSNCTPTSNSYSFPTQVTNAASQVTRMKYFTCTSQVQGVQDPNDYGASPQRAGTTFLYADTMRRLTQVKTPDGGQADTSYNDSDRTVTTTVKRTDSANLATTDTYNPLGQLVQRLIPGGRMIDITYDPHGGQWKVTNPYVNGPNQAGTDDVTYGVVETQVDALGRVKLVKKQDNNQIQITHTANASKIVDEVNRERVFEFDALGRLKNVCEVTAGNSLSSASNCNITAFSSASGYLASYTYNERDDRTAVSAGGQSRSLTYDNLSRLTGARIPEVNVSTDVTYEYDSDSNRTATIDTRGKACLEFDSLHRVTKKRHATLAQACSAGTIKAEYTYDGTAANNAIGRLITEWDGTSGSSDKADYVYDAVGRVLTMTRTVSSTAYAMTYEYDYLGNVLKLSYPSSSGTRRKVEYAFNSNGESTSVKDITDGNPNNHFNYVSSAQYSNLGPLSQMDFGSASNPVRTSLGWNSRALISSILTQVTGGGATYLNLGYVYHADGKIQQVKWNNDANDVKTENYTYDELGRLLTAQRGPNSNIQRKYSYDYDRWGNRWAQNVTAGSGLSSSLSFDTTNKNNRITSTNFSYTEGSVNAGNVTSNGASTSYTYNQESLMTAASTTLGTPSYTMDAQGRRAKKTVGGTTTDYFYAGAELVAEKTGSSWKDYIFFAGQRMAEQTGSGASTAVYLHTDHLGSTRRCTDSSGASAGTCDYEPFGENQPGTSCSVPTKFRFAGMEYDADTSFYHTWFREYDTTQGRWMAVDPLPGDGDDPQSLNRYVYVRNEPVGLLDPLGLTWACTNAFLNGQPVSGGCSWRDDGYASHGDMLMLTDERGGGGTQSQQQTQQPPPCSQGSATAGGVLGAGLGTLTALDDPSITYVGADGQVRFGQFGQGSIPGGGRTFHIDAPGPGAPNYHLNADVGPLARFNHAQVPQAAYRATSAHVLRGAGRTLFVAGVAMDAYNIATATPEQLPGAIGGAAGGVAGAVAGAAIGTALFPGPGTIIGGIIGGLAGGFAGEAIGNQVSTLNSNGCGP